MNFDFPLTISLKFIKISLLSVKPLYIVGKKIKDYLTFPHPLQFLEDNDPHTLQFFILNFLLELAYFDSIRKSRGESYSAFLAMCFLLLVREW